MRLVPVRCTATPLLLVHISTHELDVAATTFNFLFILNAVLENERFPLVGELWELNRYTEVACIPLCLDTCPTATRAGDPGANSVGTRPKYLRSLRTSAYPYHRGLRSTSPLYAPNDLPDPHSFSTETLPTGSPTPLRQSENARHNSGEMQIDSHAGAEYQHVCRNLVRNCWEVRRCHMSLRARPSKRSSKKTSAEQAAMKAVSNSKANSGACWPPFIAPSR